MSILLFHDVEVGGNLEINGNLESTTNLFVGGNFTCNEACNLGDLDKDYSIHVKGDFNANNHVDVWCGLKVEGNIKVKGNLSVEYQLSVEKNLTVDGNLILGYNSTVKGTASIAGNLDTHYSSEDTVEVIELRAGEFNVSGTFSDKYFSLITE